MDSERSPYASPRDIRSLDDCIFYHTQEIPGVGFVEGQWDLRPGIADYTGGVDVRGKRVLDVGTATGFVCFHMERQGAEVVAYDLGPDDDWDLVPYANRDVNSSSAAAVRRDVIRRLTNGFWLAHRANKSSARLAVGSVYDLRNKEIGRFDIAFFGSILLHTRDPFQALYNAACLTDETIVVTDLMPGGGSEAATMEFFPTGEASDPGDTWWSIHPAAIVRMLKVLGFPVATIRHHFQASKWGMLPTYTVVAHRSAPAFPEATQISQWTEIQSRPELVANIRDEGAPIPDGELIILGTGADDVAWYLWSGRFTANKIRELLAKNGLRFEDFGAVLDFGFGPARVLRHFRGNARQRLYGSDYNPLLVDWARENLNFAEFALNDLEGRLVYDDGFFDFVYCFSVFTHLTAEQQTHWLSELRRVLRPGGYLYLTTHGEAYAPHVPPDLSEAFQRGEMVVWNSEEAGTNSCGAYHPERYVRAVFGREFEVIDFSPNVYPQDAWLLRKPLQG